MGTCRRVLKTGRLLSMSFCWPGQGMDGNTIDERVRLHAEGGGEGGDHPVSST